MTLLRLIFFAGRSQRSCSSLRGNNNGLWLSNIGRWLGNNGRWLSNNGRWLSDSGGRGPHHRAQDATRLILDHQYSVPKDTILFKYDNPRFFRLMNVFAMSQFFFWVYLSHFAFSTMKNVPISQEKKEDKDLSWWRKINFGKYRNGIAAGSFLIGWGTLAICWMYTLRSVRYLILKKGGKELLFITYTPLGHHRSMTVPLEKVSAKQSRLSAKVHLPLKVRGTYFNYILDMSGSFLNSQLFDYSAGLRRSWAK